MGYLSVKFMLFCAVFAVLYYIVPRKMRGIVLLCANMCFYFSYGAAHILYLLFAAVTSFVCAGNLPRVKKKKELLIACIVLNVIPWFLTKGFTDWIFRRGISSTLDLIVPIGISYYLLKAVSYTVDVYKEKILPETKFWKYLLYLSYFPTVVQGPVSRYDALRGRLLHENPFDGSAFESSMMLVMLGLVKKMIVADQLAGFVDYCFGHVSELQGIVLYLAAVCYAIQLYTDFSGCVDICRGVSGVFGIHIEDNFKAPYLSVSIKQFWNRWHITFSSWLKDYIYIPLGGNRSGTVRKWLNLMTTFLISGVWHGCGVKYLIWGALNAVYQIVGECTDAFRENIKAKIGIKSGSKTEWLIRVVITFHLTVFAWIFFRAADLQDAFAYIGNMFSNLNPMTLLSLNRESMGISVRAMAVAFAHCGFLLYADWLKSREISIVQRWCNFPVAVRTCVFLLLIYDVAFFGAYGSGYSSASFMYGGF